jgi:hypothetical protein
VKQYRWQLNTADRERRLADVLNRVAHQADNDSVLVFVERRTDANRCVCHRNLKFTGLTHSLGQL